MSEKLIEIIIFLKGGNFLFLHGTKDVANTLVDSYIDFIAKLEKETKILPEKPIMFERWYRLEMGEDKLPQLVLFSQVAGIQSRYPEVSYHEKIAKATEKMADSFSEGEDWKKKEE